ncbi:hypothetical protein [Streptomyces chryseus]|uniref:hypothetical protein n=2 Tax=Streptomyces chryseus TaxID=68186 RepID=UPI00110FBF5A|nr:hypothetical protein [Streptomyces chryseus]GGX07034.1 hypothetical protein GCM10010353_23110 [Streptomyces chryseus]
MISEPEMVGDSAAWPQSETATSEDRSPSPRGRRPWLWAVGGAVTASAVWAGGLYAYGPGAGVDTRGYRVAEGLCAKVKLSALSADLGKRAEDPAEMVDEHSALDKIMCGYHFESTAKQPPGVSVQYNVEVVLETHKKTDPEPEFEALVNQPSWLDGLPPRPEEVPALGEKAFLTGMGEDEDPRLRVLDGGAVLSLEVGAEVGYDEDYYEEQGADMEDITPDLSAMPPLMVEDMRELMSVFKGTS